MGADNTLRGLKGISATHQWVIQILHLCVALDRALDADRVPVTSVPVPDARDVLQSLAHVCGGSKHFRIREELQNKQSACTPPQYAVIIIIIIIIIISFFDQG